MKRASLFVSRVLHFRQLAVSVVAALACLGAAADPAMAKPATLPSLDRVYVAPEPGSIADFALTDHNGQERRFSSLRGQPVLILFGFTHCRDVCPAALARLKALHRAQGGALRAAQVVMISVDGERDTPKVLKAYLAPLSKDFLGLTGTPRMTADIAARFSAVFVKEPPAKDGSYNVMHSEQIFVVDKQGRLRASFVGTSLEDMATVTALLIKEPA